MHPCKFWNPLNRDWNAIPFDEKPLVKLGLSYVGFYDELALFNYALSAAEVQTLYEFDGGVRRLIE